jgi:glycosyltransferase involved in cell wall biosynthesis
MMAADIFCLPSHREWFGMMIVEAAACGVPAVASRIYGITDAVDDGKPGCCFRTEISPH